MFLRYSLRSLIVVVALISVCLGIWSNNANRQRRAIRALGEFGHVVYLHEYPANSRGPDYAAEPPGPRWVRRFLGNDHFRTVRSIHFSPNDEVMRSLRDLTAITDCTIDAHQLSDDGFREIAALESLERLTIERGHKLTNASMGALSSLPSLRILRIDTTPIDGGCLKHFLELDDLEELAIGKTLITQEDFDQLKKQMPDLMVLGRPNELQYQPPFTDERRIYATNESLNARRRPKANW